VSDVQAASANTLNVQQLFAYLTGRSNVAPADGGEDTFGQNLPSDPVETAAPTAPAAKKKAEAQPSSGAPAGSGAGLTQEAKSKRDAGLAQARLDLLGLQEHGGKAHGATGARHGTGSHASTGGVAPAATGPTPTGVTGAANDDKNASGLSTLLLAQLAA
jgi:hypothetical protein